MPAEVTERKKSKFTFPTAYTILALLVVIVAVLTFVIPACCRSCVPPGPSGAWVRHSGNP
jgi:hypothetical protein